MQGKPQITADDIYSLDLSMMWTPEHPWQLDYVRRWVKQGKSGILERMIRRVDQERATLTAELDELLQGKPINVDDVDLTDEQMAGASPLDPIQVLYLRRLGIEPKVTPAGLLMQPVGDRGDGPGVRARAAWLYLENSWHMRQEEAKKRLASTI
jgi:hypothetical protein